MNGKQMKLFLVDGTPRGLTTAEITNWTGHVLSARRSDLAEPLKREEAERTGVYRLLGEDEGALGETRCYIGEADVVATGLRSHVRDKPFWNQVVVITSKNTNLTKSHGKYLESRLIELGTQAGRVTLANGCAPPMPRLPEANASDMEYFLKAAPDPLGDGTVTNDISLDEILRSAPGPDLDGGIELSDEEFASFIKAVRG
ncbi:GIY-YIG nuclease family protein [Rathayibacter sp. VKM Ac-2759]|uniref:GIY-YIG nuclease family protein n=1 Tax=Rathayibacter sp. VKM Ac-2759 TaxID=2609252 RepID=UPI001ABE4C92|nr:GIY-YIG nuclease family protein [Rathayibacter sp. VKM Ac-2759]